MKYKKNRKKTATFVLAVLIILQLAFIWGQSFMNSADSSAESSRILKIVTPFFEIFLGKGNVTENIVRKIAHFAEFSVLGILFESLVFVREKRSFIYHANAFLCGIAAAVADEAIQLFSDGRSGEIRDVLIDSAGALSGVLLCFIVCRAARALKKGR